MIQEFNFDKTKGAIFFDFDGVFTDNKVYSSSDGIEFIRCCKYDSMGLSQLKLRKFRMYVVSSESDLSVQKRCEKLEIECHINVVKKTSKLQDIADRDGLDLEKCMFVGNDINDLDAMRLVGLKVCVADGHDSIRRVSDLVLDRNGGNGAIRELCDRLISLEEH